MSSAGGKGSAPRPFAVAREEFAARWDEIFGKRVPTEADLAEQALEAKNVCPPCTGNCNQGRTCGARS